MPGGWRGTRRVRRTIEQLDAGASGRGRWRSIFRLLGEEAEHHWERVPPPLRQAIRGTIRVCSSVVFALALSAIIDSSGALDGLDGVLQREVARLRAVASPQLPAGDALAIQHIEIGATARVAHLEQRDGIAIPEIARIGGVAPISRDRMAELLADLASRLDRSGNPQGSRTRWIVAVDVDLAPLNEKATSVDSLATMRRAIDDLRAHADVVAILLPRPTVEGRRARNAFMVDAGCSRANETAATHASSAALRGLYFASPRIFHKPGGYPVDFPATLREARSVGPDGSRPVGGAAPPRFPSLGAAVYLLHRGSLQLDDIEALTALCEQAHANGAKSGSDGRLLEDMLPPDGNFDAYDTYRPQRFNWRLLDSAQFSSTVVNRLQPESLATSTPGVPVSLVDLAPSRLTGPVLLLGVDGGARHDKFEIADAENQRVSGAMLHGLQALSLDTPVSNCDGTWCGLLADVVLGLTFAVAWGLLYPMLERLRSAMPIVGGWSVAAGPIMIAAGLMFACIQIAAVGMGVDLWLNPAYLMLGLLIEAYLQGWRRAHRVSVEEQTERERFFGLSSAWGALRRGYGNETSVSGASLETDHARVETVTIAVGPGHSGAILADRVLSALLRVTVLTVGLYLLVIKLRQGA
ncbi:hypothetical protein [uncultured Methylibium sp.]|uniref:hypothetical protein n=1 Tax=uncultured Methylibium sp. TaxID=381093 RepID=UPI0025CBA5B6|nr:hypothetical protein [uncultured Methylibium sp.]